MSKAILLADDSVTIQKVIELTFMDQDYQIDAVSSGDEAIRRLDGEKPDLVIADVHMPGASGYDVARHSKEKHPEIPVLLLVGTFEPFDESEFEACGADEVLKKPFDSQELLRLVGNLLPEEAAAPEVEEEVVTATPAPESAPEVATEDENEETGVFSLDDGAFEGSSEVLPPPDLVPPVESSSESLGAVAAPVAGLAWEAPADPEPFEMESPAEETAPVAEAPAVEAAPQIEESPEATEIEAKSEESVAPKAETGDEDSAGLPSGILSDDDIERIAERVAHLVGEKLVRDIAWDVIPDLAEVVIKQRIRELESQVD